MADERGPDVVYAKWVDETLAWLVGRDDVIDAKQLNVFTVGATLLTGERLEFALQWKPEP